MAIIDHFEYTLTKLNRFLKMFRKNFFFCKGLVKTQVTVAYSPYFCEPDQISKISTPIRD